MPNEGQRRLYLEMQCSVQSLSDLWKGWAGKWMALVSAGKDSSLLHWCHMEKLDYHTITSPISTDYECGIESNLPLD